MFKAISDSAAAADGGSLALFVERLDGRVETFVVNRSIASRGTVDYNNVSSSLRTISPADYPAIADALERLLPDTAPIHPVAEFIKTLRGHGQPALHD